MKEFKKITILGVIMTLAFTTLFTVNSVAGMQKRAPLKAKIVFPKHVDRVYNLDDPKDAIRIDLLLKNVSGSAVWTEEGFDDQNFQVFLFVYGPLGKDARLITSASSKIGGSPTPSAPPEKIAVEELNSKMPLKYEKSPWAKRISIQELRDYYKLTRPGTYKLWFAMSFVQYDPANLEVVENNKDDKKKRYYVPFNDRIWSGVIEYKAAYFILKRSTTVKRSDVRVLLSEKILSSISNGGATEVTPGTDDFVLRLYSRPAWEAIYGEVNSKTFRAIANDAQLKSEALVARPADPDKGEFIFQDVAQNDFMIIGSTGRKLGYRYLWAPVKADDDRWGKKEIPVKLQLLKDINDIKAF
jgi:hypothetical protein